MSECQTFLNDAPYCYVEKVFINQLETQVQVQLPINENSQYQNKTNLPTIKQSMSQFLRDLLPGTWTFRLSNSGGGHACKSPVGGHGVKSTEDKSLWIITVSLDEPSIQGADLATHLQ